MTDTRGTLSLPPSLLFFFFLLSAQAFATENPMLNFSGLKVSQEIVGIGEQFSFEGEVKNIGKENVIIALLTIYIPEGPAPEVLEVRPFEPLEGIRLQPNEVFKVLFVLKPRESGEFRIGYMAMLKGGPVLRSATLAVEAIGEGITWKRLNFQLVLGVVLILGMLSAILKFGEKEKVLSAAYWREKWYITFIVLGYICLQVFLPYILRILPEDAAQMVKGALILYVESFGWWLLTPLVLVLHGYVLRHAVKSFLIAFIPFFVYSIYSQFEQAYIYKINMGFILYEAYLGASYGLIGAASAFFHSKKRVGIALVIAGWILLLLRPKELFF